MAYATPISQDLKREAARVMHRVLGEEPIRVDYVPIGGMTHKFAVTDAAGSQYILRIYPASRSEVVHVEPDVLRRCREAGVRVVEVITDSRCGPHADFSYIIYRRIPGERLTLVLESLATGVKNRLACEIVQQLALLNDICMTGYGDLQDSRTGKLISWKDFIDEALLLGTEALQQYSLLPSGLLERLAILRERTGIYLSETAPRLVWADVSMDNILVDNQGRLSGLIDFESCLSGDGLLSLGYCAAFYGRYSLTELLISAWPKPLGPSELTLVDWYTVVRVLRIAPYHATGFLPGGQAFAPLLTTFAGFESALRRLT